MPWYKVRLVERNKEDPYKASDNWIPLKNGQGGKFSESKIINHTHANSTRLNEKKSFH